MKQRLFQWLMVNMDIIVFGGLVLFCASCLVYVLLPAPSYEISLTETSYQITGNGVIQVQKQLPPNQQRKMLINASLVNINTAGEYELKTLPHIGPKMAKRIIAYRNEYGGFKRIEDLVKVPGIGPKTLLKLKPRISTK